METVTEEQLEVAARHYCEISDLNPDEMVPHGADPGPNGLTHAILLHSPRWQRVARVIAEHDRQMQAVEFGRKWAR